MAIVTLVEAQPWDPVNGAVVPVRLAGGGRRHYRHKGFADWRAGVVSPPRLAEALEFDGSFTGGAIPSSNAIGFMPARAATRAQIARLMWVGAPIVVSTGDDDAAVPAWTVELAGTVAGYSVQGGSFTFTIANLAGRLDKPLVTATFAGTGGIEGAASAAGRLKRRSWGRCWNIEGRLLDAAANIYEFGDPAHPIAGFDQVKDKGRFGPLALVDWAGSIDATLAALKAASAPAGGAAVAPSIACVKWYSQPVAITADLHGEVAGGYIETVAGIAAAISAAAGGPPVIDLAAAIAARPDPAYLHVDDAGERGVAVLDRLLLRATMGWSILASGGLAIAPLAFADPIATIVGGVAEREAAFAPVTAVQVGWRRNHRILAAGDISAAVLAGDVTFADGKTAEEMKPAQPGADVTGANTAKDTAAVAGRPAGEVIQQLSDFDAAIIAGTKRTDALVSITIPAVEKAVLEAGDRITDARGIADKARTDIDAEIERARGAEGQLRERIDSVAAEGGYDDTAVYAEISRVDRAAISAEAAIGERIDQVQASFTSGGNLLSNTDFTTLDGWTQTANLPGGVYGRNAAGQGWMAGGEDNLSFYQAGRDAGGDGAIMEAISDPFTVAPSSFVQFYAFTASHRSRAWVSLYFYNTTGALVGYAGENTAARVDNGGRDPNAWDQTGLKSYRVPADAVTARMLLRKYNTFAGATPYDSYAWFWRPFVGIARAGQTSWNPYSPGNGKAVQIASTARIKETTDALARADVAFAEQARGIEASLGTVDTRIGASANDLTRAFTDGDRALGSRSTVLEAAASTVSSSAVFNDNFNFWPDGATLPSRWFLWSTSGNFRTNRLAPGRGGGQYCVQTLNDVAEVDSGFFQTIYTAGAGKWVIEVTADFDGSGARGAGVTLHGVWNLDFCSEPDVNGVVGDRANVVRSWSKMVDLDGRDQINVHAMLGWSGFGRGMAAKYMVWHRLALRPATDGEIKAGKADAALNNPGGVLAKMTGYDATLADLPNRYAAVSSLSTLEAQVNFAADSGLQRTLRAAIEDRATVIADSKAGAVAETVRVLRGEYNGTVGEVRDQRGVLNGLNGKTAAYVRFIADAGNGRAALSLWSDANGGAWSLTGDGLVDGNLTVTGSITGRAIADNAITGGASYLGGSVAFSSSAATNVGSVGYVGSGGRASIAVSGVVTLGPSAPAGTRLQIYLSLNGSIIIGPIYVSSTRGAPIPFSFTTVTTVSGSQTITLTAQATNGSGSGDPHLIDSPAIILTEFKK